MATPTSNTRTIEKMEDKDKDKERDKDKDKKKRVSALLGFGKKGTPVAPLPQAVLNEMEKKGGKDGLRHIREGRKRTLSKSRRERPPSALDRSAELPHLYQLLADNKLNEHEVWEGDPGLFPVIYQFKEQFEKMEPFNSVVTVYLPTLPEFGGHSSKCYKINSELTSYEAVSLICKRLGVANPHRYCLSTLRQFIMADNEPLFIYGLGTLFEKWELQLMLKSDMAPNYNALLETPQAPNTENIVIFNLPPLQEFGGLNKKVMKVSPTLSIHEVIESICSKYKVANPERFSVITTKESKWQFVLYPNATLGDYGFGTRIFKWEVDLVFSALLPYFITHHTYRPSYGWCQVEQIPLETLAARLIIASLEPIAATATKLQKEMGFMKNLLTATQKDLRSTRAQLAEASTSVVGANGKAIELEAQLEKAARENTALEKQYAEAQEQLVLLQQENSTLSSNLTTHTTDLATARAQLTTVQNELHIAQKQDVSSKALIVEKESLIAFIKSELQGVQADLDQKVIKIDELSTALGSSSGKQTQLQEELQQAQINNDENARYLKITKDELAAALEELHTLKEIYNGKLDYATATSTYAEDRANKAESQLRDTERKAAETEMNFRREIENMKKDVLAQRRAAEEKAKQEQETATRLIERKYNVTVNELKAELQKALEKEDTIKEMEITIYGLAETRDNLTATIQEWTNKATEWEAAKKEMNKVIVAKEQLENRLAQANSTISQLTRAKEEEEKKTRQVTLVSERIKIELGAEKERVRTLGEQLRNMVDREESGNSRPASDAAKSAAKMVVEEVLTARSAPPPPPSPPVAPILHKPDAPKNTKANDLARRTISANDFLVKRGDLKPVAKPAPKGQRTSGTPPITLADVLFASMQKRFQSINSSDDDVEDLDGGTEDDISETASSSDEESDEWRVF